MTGNELKTWREELMLTQGQLAEALSVDVMTISRWEREVRSIPPHLPLALETVERNLARKKVGESEPAAQPQSAAPAKPKMTTAQKKAIADEQQRRWRNEKPTKKSKTKK